MTMSPTSDKKSNFFFANCLQCEGIIRIPITIRPDSSVGCPHCKSQFDLYALLDHIPEVSVEEAAAADLSDSSEEFQIDTATSAEKQDGKFVVPPQLAAGMRKRRRRRRRSSESSSTDSQSGSSSSGSSLNGHSTGASTSSSDSIDPNRQLSEAEELRLARREERAQKERDKIQQQREAAALRAAGQHRRSGSSRRAEPKQSAVFEATKIIIGGMLAAPIAYLLLMWVFSRDPLGLVPTINSYAPVLVPEALILDDEDDEGVASVPQAESDSEDLFNSLPIPETDPDDVDIDADLFK